MKHIFVATDLSERSRPALRRAVALAMQSAARLTVVHIVDNALPNSLSQQVQIGAKAMISEQVAEDSHGGAPDVNIRVIVGDVVESIQEFTEDTEADLLVVGEHRRRAFLDQIRETTVEHMIRASRVPVLLVTQASREAYTHVLCGVDLSRVCAAALTKIPMVAPDAKLTLFHAHDVSFSREARQEYATWKAMYPMPKNLPEPIFVEASATEALREVMQDGSYDLLALGAHTRSNAGRYILGGFTAGLVRQPPCDLLIAK